MSKFQTTARALAPAIAIAAALTCGAGANAAAPLADGFDEGFEAGLPTGWTVINKSFPVGPESWQRGDPFFLGAAQAGGEDSFVMVNFNSTTGGDGTISNWLISPTLSFRNGDVVTFWTKANGDFPDRLQLRFSTDTNGVAEGGTSVGDSATSVGTFNTLLLAVNPDLKDDVYPTEWTELKATISGLSGPTDGAIAFRYFVTEGGPTGANSDMIGVDSVSITAVPEPTTYLLMALGLGVIGLRRMRATRG